MGAAWSWDETLYTGSAEYYAVGRLSYPERLGEQIASQAGLHGHERAIDVGCGPGSLTLLLAPYVGHIVGIDADPEMIDHASATARHHDIRNVSWRHMRAEDLPADLGTVDLVTFAQSFHWMNRLQVATIVQSMLTPNGCCIHVHATTHRGDASQDALPHPRPPYEAIDELVRTHLGPERRAGRSSLPRGALPQGTAGGDEASIYRQARFDGPHHVEVPRGEIVDRSIDQIIAATFSLSSSTPHLFGTQRSSFEHQLNTLLNDASDHGRFSERARDIAFDIWRPRPALT